MANISLPMINSKLCNWETIFLSYFFWLINYKASYLAASTWPWLHAMCNGVNPWSFLRSVFTRYFFKCSSKVTAKQHLSIQVLYQCSHSFFSITIYKLSLVSLNGYNYIAAMHKSARWSSFLWISSHQIHTTKPSAEQQFRVACCMLHWPKYLLLNRTYLNPGK